MKKKPTGFTGSFASLGGSGPFPSLGGGNSPEQQIITIDVNSDTTIFSGSPTATNGNASTGINIGTSSGPTVATRRGLVRFPSAALDGIPINRVQKATIKTKFVVGSNFAEAFSIFPIERSALIDWGDISWNNYDQSGGLGWTTPGGDYTEPAGTITHAIPPNSTREFDITAGFLPQFEDMLGLDYFAFIFKMVDEVAIKGFQMDSLEAAEAFNQKLLVYLK